MLRIATVLFLSVSGGFAMAQAPPSAAWRVVPKTAPTDLTVSAGDDGTLTFAGNTTPARLYVTCSNVPAYGITPMLKVVFRAPPSLPTLLGANDMESISGGTENEAKPDPHALQAEIVNGAFRTIQLQTLPLPIDIMLENDGSKHQALIDRFTTPAGVAEFRFPIPAASAPTSYRYRRL